MSSRSEIASHSLAENLWESNDSKDFTFIVGSQEIKAHKCVLTNYSPILKAIAETENTLEITEFNFDVVETAIKFRYEISEFHRFIVDDLISIMKFADQYETQCLKKAVENFLLKKVSYQTVCKLANASMDCNADGLKTKCSAFLRKCILTQRAVKNTEILDKTFTKEFAIKVIPKKDGISDFGLLLIAIILFGIVFSIGFVYGKDYQQSLKN